MTISQIVDERDWACVLHWGVIQCGREEKGGRGETRVSSVR